MKCKVCGAYKGHSPDCSKMSGKYAKLELKRYWLAWQVNENKLRKIRKILS